MFSSSSLAWAVKVKKEILMAVLEISAGCDVLCTHFSSFQVEIAKPFKR